MWIYYWYWRNSIMKQTREDTTAPRIGNDIILWGKNFGVLINCKNMKAIKHHTILPHEKETRGCIILTCLQQIMCKCRKWDLRLPVFAQTHTAPFSLQSVSHVPHSPAQPPPLIGWPTEVAMEICVPGQACENKGADFEWPNPYNIICTHKHAHKLPIIQYWLLFQISSLLLLEFPLDDEKKMNGKRGSREPKRY